MRCNAVNVMMGLFFMMMLGLTGCGGGGGGTTAPAGTNSAPVANAGAAQNVVTGAVVTLDGSASSDSNGDTLTYKWSFTTKPVGSNATIANIAKPTFTADTAGGYTISLVVNDGKIDGTSSTVMVTVVDPTIVGGIINTDTTWTLAKSPYKLTSNVQIAQGATLTIEPGVIVSGSSITVFGTLNAVGNSGKYIEFSNMSIAPANDPSLSIKSNIIVRYCKISNCSFYGRTGSRTYAALQMSDCILTNSYDVLNIWYPYKDCYIERNVFVDYKGVEVALASNNLYITNNLFIKKTDIQPSVPTILAQQSYGSEEVIVSKNTFYNNDKIAIKIPPSMSGIKVKADNNFFNTTDISIISKLIYDRNIDLGSAYIINYLPILTSPDPNTPSATPYLN